MLSAYNLLSTLPILIALAFAQQAQAQAASEAAPMNEAAAGVRADPMAGVVSPPPAKWIPPQQEEARDINAKANAVPRVRIGLRLTPFNKVMTREKDGKVSSRFVPSEPLRHTLRARLNQPNHFFVGEWHIESKPLKWVQKSRRYEVRLSIYRRYGAFGQLEENVGYVDLAGVLDEQENNVHVLIGVARARLRDKFQNPLLDVVAGFAPGTTKQGPTISQQKAPARRVPDAPMESNEALIRGRF
jgi:hypothetical protein